MIAPAGRRGFLRGLVALPLGDPASTQFTVDRREAMGQITRLKPKGRRRLGGYLFMLAAGSLPRYHS